MSDVRMAALKWLIVGFQKADRDADESHALGGVVAVR
jgi:hypothetical protein